MKLVKRIKAPTPPENKEMGKILTVIAVICTALLGSGLEFDRLGTIVLVAGASLSGVGMVYHAQKVDEHKLKDDQEHG
jgi:hypothetical protein